MSPEGLTLIGPLGFGSPCVTRAGCSDAVGGPHARRGPRSHTRWAMASATTNGQLRAFTVRKEAKAHGAGKLIEGLLSAGGSRRRHRGHGHDRQFGADRRRRPCARAGGLSLACWRSSTAKRAVATRSSRKGSTLLRWRRPAKSSRRMPGGALRTSLSVESAVFARTRNPKIGLERTKPRGRSRCGSTRV